MDSGNKVKPGSLAGAFASLAALNPGGQDKLAAALNQAGFKAPKAPAASRDEVVAMSAPVVEESVAESETIMNRTNPFAQLEARISEGPVYLKDFVRVVEQDPARALLDPDLIAKLLKQNLNVIMERLAQRTQEREALGVTPDTKVKRRVFANIAASIEELQRTFLVLRPNAKDGNTLMSLLRSNDAHITREVFMKSVIQQLEKTSRTPLQKSELTKLRGILDEKINAAGLAIDKMLLQTIYHSASNPILAKHGILRNRELMATEGLPTQFQYFDDSNRPSLQDLANHLLHTIQTRKAINKTEHGEQALKLTEGRFRQ